MSAALVSWKIRMLASVIVSSFSVSNFFVSSLALARKSRTMKRRFSDKKGIELRSVRRFWRLSFLPSMISIPSSPYF